MNESVLDRYIKVRPPSETPATETDEPDDFGSFGWLRGVRDRALMLELRFRDGSVTAFSLAWLERAEFNPSEGIVLHLGGKRVRIAGRNLNSETRPNVRLFAGIVRHRVPWIQEADEPAMLEASPRATVIEQIEVK
jgi:hypothetical protein